MLGEGLGEFLVALCVLAAIGLLLASVVSIIALVIWLISHLAWV